MGNSKYTAVWADDVAQRLDDARQAIVPIQNLATLGLLDDDASLVEAYAAQDTLIDRHLSRGDRVLGYKVAITQKNKLVAMRLNAPVHGKLLASAAISDGAELDPAALIAPRIEPEIAFVIGRPLEGPGCTIAEVSRAVDYITPAFEILDSRYVPGPFHLLSAVADNVSSSHHVLSANRYSLNGLDLPTLGCALYRNGDVIGTGAGAQVMGHPLLSLVALINDLATRGERLDAGSVVLSGGLVEAQGVRAGDAICARFHGLGDVSVTLASLSVQTIETSQ